MASVTADTKPSRSRPGWDQEQVGAGKLGEAGGSQPVRGDTGVRRAAVVNSSLPLFCLPQAARSGPGCSTALRAACIPHRQLAG